MERRTSIRGRLLLVILITTFTALLVTAGCLFVFQIGYGRDAFRKNTETIAQILARNCSASLEFQDADAARENLQSVQAANNVVAAQLQDSTGKPFVSYPSGADFPRVRASKVFPVSNFTGDSLIVIQPIYLEKEAVGSLHLRADYGPYYLNLLRVSLGMLGSVLVAALVVAVFVSWKAQRLVSGPIQQLAAAAREIAAASDYSLRVKRLANDEVGDFTDAFNRMIEQIESRDTELHSEIKQRERAQAELAATQLRLIDASREAGMAEIATGVLHNVGNVLNSVNVSTSLLDDALRKSKFSNVQKLSNLLQENCGRLAEFFSSDPRGEASVSYLKELGDVLQNEHTLMNDEVESLKKNIEHIKDIVSMQQTYARRGGFIETVSLSNLVDDALRMNSDSIKKHEIAVTQSCDNRARVTVDRHKVLQILVNLIRNSIHAVNEADTPLKELTLAITRESKNEGSRVMLTVHDTGIGIPKENLTRIFSHGFTTRVDGHGFGLHSGAVAAQEMGGSLTASSEGLGKGATFTLILPAAESSSAARAS